MLPALSFVIAREHFCGVECCDQDSVLRRSVEDRGEVHDRKFLQARPRLSQIGAAVETLAAREPQAVVGV